MTTPEIEEFAKLLVQAVRDAAIQSSDRELEPQSKSGVGIRWREAAQSKSPQDFAKTLIPDIVDDVIFYLLHAIDDGGLKLSFTASNGRCVDLGDEGLGELAGWYMGTRCWRAKYASERFVDDFADLDPE